MPSERFAGTPAVASAAAVCSAALLVEPARRLPDTSSSETGAIDIDSEAPTPRRSKKSEWPRMSVMAHVLDEAAEVAEPERDVHALGGAGLRPPVRVRSGRDCYA